MKPGVDVACTGILPHAFAVSYTTAAVADCVASPLTTSTNGSTGAGLKKCMPTTRPGCFNPAASAVIDSDDVLDARIASGDHHHFQFAQQLALDVEILDDRLDHQLRADEVAERVHRSESRQSRRRRPRASSLPFAASAASVSPIFVFA